LKATVGDRCTSCGRKFDEVVFRYDSSAYCTICQWYESAEHKASLRDDRREWCRINGRCW